MNVNAFKNQDLFEPYTVKKVVGMDQGQQTCENHFLSAIKTTLRETLKNSPVLRFS
jgi:hypothetical protein